MPPADGTSDEEPVRAQVTSKRHRYSPYSPARPGRVPPPPAIGSSPLRGVSQTSQPPTPVKGLTAEELKGIPKEWNSAAKIAQLVEDALTAFTKETIPPAEVLDWLKESFKSAVNTSILLLFAYNS
jgi:hypothetical protein